MSDLIDRQAAIDALHTWFKDGFDEDKWWNSTHVLAAIEGLPSAQPEQRWIPISERLPNCNGCYLVWRPHFFGGEIGMPSICYFDGSNTWHDSYGIDFERILHSDDVVAWMPLPDPYKEGER